MDTAERMAWDEAVERATCLDAPATVDVPSDVLIAVDAEFRPSSDARPASRSAAMMIAGFLIGSVLAAVVMGLMGAS